MERREWRVGSRSSRDATIYENGQWIAQVGIDYADEIVNDHNQHAALVEQRDKLDAHLKLAVKVLRKFIAADNCNYTLEAMRADGMFALAEYALASILQPNEPQAKGGSG